MTSTTRLRAVTVAGCLGLALAGCGSERPNESESEFLHGAGGVNTRVGEVLLRDVSIDEPEADEQYGFGDTVRLRVTLFNQAERPETFLGVSSPVAASSYLLVDPDCDGTFERVGELPLPAQPPVRTPSVDVPDGQEVYYYVGLVLDEPIRSGQFFPATFTFRNAGSTTVQVPVELEDLPLVGDDPQCEPRDTT